MNRLTRWYTCWASAVVIWSGAAVHCAAQATVGTPPSATEVLLDWPTIYYAAIDVSSGVQGENNVEDVLLSDDGKVVFRYSTNYHTNEDADAADDHDTANHNESFVAPGSYVGTDYHVCTWQNGQVVNNQSTKLRSVKVYHYPLTDDPNFLGTEEIFNYTTAIGGMTLDGQLYGEKARTINYVYYGLDGDLVSSEYYGDYEWLLKGGGATMLRYLPPTSLFKLPADVIYTSNIAPRFSICNVSTSGNTIVLAQDVLLSSQSDDDQDKSTYYYINNGGVPTLFAAGAAGWSVNNGVNTVPAAPVKVNDSGWAIGPSIAIVGSGDAVLWVGGYIWAGGTFVDLSNAGSAPNAQDSPVDINNQNQVVVSAADTGDAGTGGYLWEMGTEGAVKTYLRDMLPVSLQGQVSSIQPYKLSNQAADGTIYILATAIECERSINVRCQRDGLGVWRFAKALIPDETNIKGINSSSLVVSLDSTVRSARSHPDQAPTPPTVIVAKKSYPVTISFTVTRPQDSRWLDNYTSDPNNPNEFVATLQAFPINLTLQMQQVPGHTISLNVVQDIQLTIAKSYIDGSSAYCATSLAPNQVNGGFISDDLDYPYPTNTFPNNTIQCVYEDKPYHRLTRKERQYIASISYNGIARDYVTATIDGIAQPILEIDWTFAMNLKFHSPSAGASNPPMTAEVPPKVTTSRIPLQNGHSQNVTRTPTANTYVQDKANWVASDFPAGNNQAKMFCRPTP